MSTLQFSPLSVSSDSIKPVPKSETASTSLAVVPETLTGTLRSCPADTLSTHPQHNSQKPSPSRISTYCERFLSSLSRESIFLFMGVSIGGLGVMSLRSSFSEVTPVALVKGDIRTVMGGTICLIVLLILGEFLFCIIPRLCVASRSPSLAWSSTKL
jgi:hypothetical protein